MSTKFILIGGGADELRKENDVLFSEILCDTSENLKILLVFFAADENRIPEKKKEYISQFERNKGEKEVSYEVADEKTFMDQIKSANIIYLHGGDTLKLLNTLKKFPGLKNMFDGKVVAGESAGSYVLSAFFYSKTIGAFLEGLGFVSVRTICHYEGVNSEKLDAGPADMEKLLLPDYKFRVFEL